MRHSESGNSNWKKRNAGVTLWLFLGKPVGSRFGQMVRKTCKSRHGIAFTIPQISSILRITNAKAWNWYQRWLNLKKWNTNFRLECSVRKNKTTFWDVSLIPEISRRNDLKSRVLFTSQPVFPENFANGKQPMSRLSTCLAFLLCKSARSFALATFKELHFPIAI